MRKLISILTMFAFVSSAMAYTISDDVLRIGIPGSSSTNKTFKLGTTGQFIYNHSTSKLQYSHDGSTFKTVGLASDLDSGAASSGQVLTANGSGASSFATPASAVYTPPTMQSFLTGSSGTYNKDYAFTVTSASATVGATYTHNSVTYTVYATIASQTRIYLSGSAAPLASGTLTKASGTGDATITFSSVASPTSLTVIMVAGGGGGGGGGAGGGGGTGGVTSFGSLFSCSGGTGGGANAGANGTGGTCTISSPGIGIPIPGGNGNAGQQEAFASNANSGGQGGAAAYFGGGGGETTGADPGIVNTGGGGSGGGGSTAKGGSGGGAGGFIEGTVPSPAATYAWSLGASGTGGSAGGAGATGGIGGTGAIYVFEKYQ